MNCYNTAWSAKYQLFLTNSNVRPFLELVSNAELKLPFSLSKCIFEYRQKMTEEKNIHQCFVSYFKILCCELFFEKKRILLLHSKSYCKGFQEISVQQTNKGSMSKKIYTHMCLSSWTTEVESSSYSQKFPLLLQNNGFWGKNSHGFSIHQADLTVNLILLNCHSNLSLRSVFFTMGYEASV